MIAQDRPQEMVIFLPLVQELGLREVGDVDRYLKDLFEFSERQRQVGHADTADDKHIHIALRRPFPPRDRAIDKRQVYPLPERL